MRDLLEGLPEPEDPHEKARAHARKALPKRFYTSVSVAPAEDGGFAILLDGRAVRSPAKALVSVPVRAIAEGLAAEWDAQKDIIDPGRMPLTRLVNSVLDAVAADPEPVRAEIVKYACSDLVCYRAEGPESLTEAQAAAWDPVLAFARDRFGAEFRLAGGIVHIEQPAETIAAIAEAVRPFDVFRLSALHVVTTLTGSALIALALAHGVLDEESAFAAAHVDESWNAERWGLVPEAEAPRAARRSDMMAAALVLREGAARR